MPHHAYPMRLLEACLGKAHGISVLGHKFMVITSHPRSHPAQSPHFVIPPPTDLYSLKCSLFLNHTYPVIPHLMRQPEFTCRHLNSRLRIQCAMTVCMPLTPAQKYETKVPTPIHTNGVVPAKYSVHQHP